MNISDSFKVQWKLCFMYECGEEKRHGVIGYLKKSLIPEMIGYL